MATDALVLGTSTPTPGGQGRVRTGTGPSTAKPAWGHGPRVLGHSLPVAGVFPATPTCLVPKASEMLPEATSSRKPALISQLHDLEGPSTAGHVALGGH